MGRHCKLFGCDFLARGGIPGYAFCNGLLFSGNLRNSCAGKVFLLFADVAFGTGEGLMVYGMDALYRRGAPGVRDAFSKALGAKNRRFRYGRDIRYQKPPPTVRGAVHHFIRALHRK